MCTGAEGGEEWSADGDDDMAAADKEAAAANSLPAAAGDCRPMPNHRRPRTLHLAAADLRQVDGYHGQKVRRTLCHISRGTTTHVQCPRLC